MLKLFVVEKLQKEGRVNPGKNTQSHKLEMRWSEILNKNTLYLQMKKY